MFALGARVEALQAIGDTVFDTLVVAGLKVQAIVFPLATPVASVERIGGAKVQGSRHRPLSQVSQYHHGLLPQGGGDLGKKSFRQVPAVPAALGVSELVETMELAPL